jgi:hypothetical protein
LPATLPANAAYLTARTVRANLPQVDGPGAAEVEMAYGFGDHASVNAQLWAGDEVRTSAVIWPSVHIWVGC